MFEKEDRLPAMFGVAATGLAILGLFGSPAYGQESTPQEVMMLQPDENLPVGTRVSAFAYGVNSFFKDCDAEAEAWPEKQWFCDGLAVELSEAFPHINIKSSGFENIDMGTLSVFERQELDYVLEDFNEASNMILDYTLEYSERRICPESFKPTQPDTQLYCMELNGQWYGLETKSYGPKVGTQILNSAPS